MTLPTNIYRKTDTDANEARLSSIGQPARYKVGDIRIDDVTGVLATWDGSLWQEVTTGLSGLHPFLLMGG